MLSLSAPERRSQEETAYHTESTHAGDEHSTQKSAKYMDKHLKNKSRQKESFKNHFVLIYLQFLIFFFLITFS